MSLTSFNTFFSIKDAVNLCAARHGPSVWLLDGPTPILNISKTEMASWLNVFLFIEHLLIQHQRSGLNPGEWNLPANIHIPMTGAGTVL